MLAQNDRIAFSLNIVTAPATVANFASAKAQVQTQVAALQNLDNANANLFAPVNTMINSYQLEANYLDNNLRTAITEQNIQDAGNKIINNYFFPNNTAVAVPSLSASNNIWTKSTPYALTFAIGKNAVETYNQFSGESYYVTQILALIASASANRDIENTSGENATLGNPTAMPPVADSIQADTAVVALKTNLVSMVNSYLAVLALEKSAIVTTDKNAINQSNNNAAIAAIPTIVSALNTWLGYPDFRTPSVSTYAAFYAYNANLLAPTKLHSTQLSALQAALTVRQTVNATRYSQLTAVLGTITQDVTTGIATGTGLYGTRYNYLSLRLNSLGGSLSQLLALSGTTNAQTAAAANVTSTASTYAGILPTTLFSAPANGTAILGVVDSSKFSIGDTVFVYAEGQTELQRSIKSISGNSVTLNDVIPAKYSPASNGRMYKDLT